jgi:hypothetical protein
MSNAALFRSGAATIPVITDYFNSDDFPPSETVNKEQYEKQT